jgi:hypothetical protein
MQLKNLDHTNSLVIQHKHSYSSKFAIKLVQGKLFWTALSELNANKSLSFSYTELSKYKTSKTENGKTRHG